MRIIMVRSHSGKWFLKKKNEHIFFFKNLFVHSANERPRDLTVNQSVFPLSFFKKQVIIILSGYFRNNSISGSAHLTDVFTNEEETRSTCLRTILVGLIVCLTLVVVGVLAYMGEQLCFWLFQFPSILNLLRYFGTKRSSHQIFMIFECLSCLRETDLNLNCDRWSNR